MLRKIESLRKKSPEVRNRYAFIISLTFTSVIALAWLVSMPSRIGVLSSTLSTPTQNDVQGGFSRSFTDLRASVVQAMSRFSPDAGRQEEVTDSKVQQKSEEVSSSTQPINFVDLVRASSAKKKNKTSDFGQAILIATSSSADSTSSGDY